MKIIKNTIKHFIVVMHHKFVVLKLCIKAGIPYRGLVHDLSKFSPTEFINSVKYFNEGKGSPIKLEKKDRGYSKAWLHHKGRNPHHYEYWQDNFDKGGEALQMPFYNALELICDYLAAGKAYMKKNFTYAGEYKWWQGKKANPLAMHPQTKIFVEIMLKNMADTNSCNCLKKNIAFSKYNEAIYISYSNQQKWEEGKKWQ